MPKNSKYERCLKDVRQKIKLGVLPKSYKCGRKKCKSNEYKICARLRRK